MTDLSPQAKALLESAKAAEPGPTPADKHRIKALIVAGIAAVPTGAEAASGGASAAKAGATVKAAGWLAGATVAVGLGVAGYVANLESDVRPVLEAPEIIKKADPKPPRMIRVEPAVETAAPTPPPVVRRTRAVSPAPSIAEEARLIRTAKRALQQGQHSAALEALEAHATKHPDGQLRLERIAVRAEVLCAMGRAEEADRLRSQIPESSPYRAAIDRACE